MLTYQISTGVLTDWNGHVLGIGYSGQPQCKNDPSACDQKNMGPIPPGRYSIGAPVNTQTHGPYVLPLTPHPDNEMHGRNAFLIHGDSISKPGTASHGCIILARGAREAIRKSGDDELEVVP